MRLLGDPARNFLQRDRRTAGGIVSNLWAMPETQIVSRRFGRSKLRSVSRFSIGTDSPRNYLGVMFVGGPDTLEPDAADVGLALMYPEVPYGEVQPEADLPFVKDPWSLATV